MNPYVLTLIVFSVLLGIVWIVVSMWKTVYLPNMSETTNAQEDVETRKEKANKIRSRRFVFGIGGVVVLCLLTMLGIWLSSPVKKVYAALNPSSTPTITNTPTATATRTPTRTPRNSPTPRSDISHTAGGPTVTGTPPTATRTKTLAPSGSGSGGGSVIVQTRIVSVIQTRIVSVTRIVIHTVVVTVTSTGSVTPSSTPTITSTPTVTSTITETGTPTETVTSTPTETETPTPP